MKGRAMKTAWLLWGLVGSQAFGEPILTVFTRDGRVQETPFNSLGALTFPEGANMAFNGLQFSLASIRKLTFGIPSAILPIRPHGDPGLEVRAVGEGIRFRRPGSGPIAELAIFDSRGTLLKSFPPLGTEGGIWDGKSDGGKKLTPCLCILRYKSDGRIHTLLAAL